VSKDEFIFGGDRLVFSGDVERILELRKSHQLVNATHHVFTLDEVDRNRRLQMANVRFTSPLVGKKMEDTDFEEKNDVVLVAVAREGERIQQSPREVVLEKGDTLLLECSPSFLKHPANYQADLQLFDSEKVPNIGSKIIDERQPHDIQPYPDTFVVSGQLKPPCSFFNVFVSGPAFSLR